ncbi:hypothetical protein Kpol_1004p5 [Vanderwaltozyma polyspora DSM 70294]|uniref:Non-structural maintenance of chromosomes element 1 homolog n=1 Tax=Vanderwaltozyma polyspora (strain ATCC 22028 / DSM 70294 / BCRC 21397 / CBS 2163 / NBRC 10782 / NRRL Y-8283 / UCD 57-17) TaxID=436907 RepID=A7TJ64_VANPO|nr:uncharacterized protein Kpol_1004p5 [Vanderwaltozyma polyspora DSM 70294]EDO17633.1 hypothetical protein Kpol_1004p5 [Vanderwaltozyma polyspora DSM 70294]
MLSVEDKGRYLLQYLLDCRGICHENALLLVLIKLDKDSVDEEGSPNRTFEDYLKYLQDIVDEINVKLNRLNYKIVRINHPSGARVISRYTKSYLRDHEQDFGSFFNLQDPATSAITANNNDQNVSIELPQSSRYYVYINLESNEETKLATRFSLKEIEFIKWAIQEFMINGSTIETTNRIPSSIIVKEINRILKEVSTDESPQFWNSYCTFTKGSLNLSKFRDLTASETDDLLIRLCRYKWFYRTDEGTFGMDLRCITELEQYLIETFEFKTCTVCKHIVLQGVLCRDAQTDENCSMWHVDCFQHYITHSRKSCSNCESDLMTQGVYVI